MSTLMGSLGAWLAALGAALIIYFMVRNRWKKAGPDEALIVYGKRKLFGRKVIGDEGQVEGFRIVRGGGTFVWPAWEQHEILSLKMMTLDIDLHHVYTVQGILINVRVVAQVKVKGDFDHIRKAAEGFLGLPTEQIQSTIKETVSGHLRGIIGTLTIEELYRDQKRFQDSVRVEAHEDLREMGFEFRSFVFQEIQDDEGYLKPWGNPRFSTPSRMHGSPLRRRIVMPRLKRRRLARTRNRSAWESTGKSPYPAKSWI